MAATVAGRPYNDYADNWCSLFELFVSVSGLKLRLNIPDTVIVKDGRMLGWFYTNREGVVCRCALHEISPSVLFQKLVGSSTLDEEFNPYGYVALCHFESGISRPLKQQELQHLLSDLVGPYETARPPLDPSADMPFCIQAYIIPQKDLRYLTTYGGADQATCTTFARRFSTRYTHISDSPIPLNQMLTEASGDAEQATLTAEELIVESQLVAMGLLERRTRPEDEESDENGFTGPSTSELRTDAMIPASKRAKAEMARQIQGLVSYVERAHGLRIQGLVTEFVQAHSQVFVLMAVHAVQWDGRASRGRLGTFTERWQDYTAGMGPAPAAQPPGKKSNAPGLLLANDNNSLVMTERSAGLAVGAAMLAGGGNGGGGSAPASPGAFNGGGVSAGDSWARKSSLGRAPFVHHNVGQLADMSHVTVARPGSAPAHVVHRFRPPYAPNFPGPRNGHSSIRNAVASARRGAGGNPSNMPPAADSYALFTSREMLSTDTIAGTLVLEVELLKERLQRQADIAVRAESALTQLAVSSQCTQSNLLRQLAEARDATDVAAGGRMQIESEYERLRSERGTLTMQITALEKEVSQARAALSQDRATLADTVRSAASKEEGLEDLCNRLRNDNDHLNQQVVALQRRLEEESEVVEAARNQLYDYRQMVGQLQNQLRRGKNKPAVPGAPPVLSSSVGSFNGIPPPGSLPAPSPGNQYNPRISGVNNNVDGLYENGSDQGSPAMSGGGADAAVKAGKAGPNKRPGNSPLNPAVRSSGVRAFGKSDTAPARSSVQGSLYDQSCPSSPPLLQTRTSSLAPDGAVQRSPRGDASASMWRSQAPHGLVLPPNPGNLGQISHLGQGSISPRGGYANAPKSPPIMGYPNNLMSPGTPTANQSIVLALLSPTTDPIGQLIAELRHARKYGGNNDQNPFLNQGENGEKADGPGGEKKKKLTMSDKKERVQNPWKPNYDSVHLNDLFMCSGELTEHMTETLQHTIALLKSYEPQLLEIYNYYAVLSQVQYIDDKLIMVESQFTKLSKFTGLANGQQGLDIVEDVFHQVAERVTNYYSEFMPKENFITFHEFPEAVCRLAAARYDWRPPENPDEADDDIEQPESLRTVPLANISELPNCNQYGVGPTAKLPKETEIKAKSRATSAAGARPSSAAPHQSAAVSGGDGDQHGGEGDRGDSGSVIAAVSELGPQPADVVLYTIIKTYLLYNLLPNVKHNRTSGSKHSKAKVGTRTVAETVWV